MGPQTDQREGESVLAYTLVAMVCHGMLLTGLVVLFIMAVPKFKEIYASFGTTLPVVTSFLIDVSDFTRQHVAFVLVSLPVLLVADAALLIYLQNNARPIWSFLWSSAVYCLIGFGYFFVIVGLFLPVQPLS